jgi:hypothetical protein
VLKSPFAPLIAQLTDRAGMMMSPKPPEQGDKFGESGLSGLALSARAAGSHGVRKVRRLLEQGKHLHRSRGVSAIVDSTVRL